MKTLSQKLKIPAKCIWKLNNQIPLTKLNKLKFWLHFSSQIHSLLKKMAAFNWEE